MVNFPRILIASLALTVCGAAFAQIPTIDGQRDAVYVKASAQDTQTAFGDNNLGLIDFANGSEADNVYYVRTATDLYLFIGGNVGADNGVYNKVSLFFDHKTGGYNRLPAGLPDVDFNRFQLFGDDGSGNGLTFDAGFAADSWMGFVAGGSPVGVFVNFSQVETVANGGTAYYVGSTTPGSNGTLTGGNNPNGVAGTINNSNIAGATDGLGTMNTAVTDAVTTGIELKIPLTQLGSPTGDIRLCVFVFNDGFDFLSNQVLPGIGGGDNLGDPRQVNFGNIPGVQYVTIPGSSEVVVKPESFTVRRGRVDAGNLQSLQTEDNNSLRVCKFIVQNLAEPPVNVEVNSTSPTASPSALKTSVTSRMFHTGSFRQTIELFNFVTNNWDATDVRSDAINTVMTKRELTATGSLARYVGPAGAVRCRYTIRQTGPAAVINWCHETDMVAWTISN
ncbi:MAG: hypothetical protein KIT11_04710 [Fimbriimonadaceae bacterium]|nr:hypothetical protein [Fimbriimonadaceae bacterium]QYK56806.1 MAG: hypothetical protein KF733_04815 [Fimbriimonadaceae bacterium]